MAFALPPVGEMFGDVDAKSAASMFDAFTASVQKSIGNGSTDPMNPPSDPMAMLENLTLNKALDSSALAGLQSALASQRLATQDIQKDISLTSPLATGFVQFDLEAPAKMLAPKPTPLRNMIPRTPGNGKAHAVKRILGFTGSGTGGVGNLWPGITDSTQNTFGGVNYLRGPKISYAADDLTLPYNQYSLSDQVSFQAQFSGKNFQDMRSLSSASVLWATMLMEERMMLMARGTASAYSGALASPTITTAAPATAGNQTALAAATYYIAVTADAGVSTSGFGESILSAISTQIVGAGAVLTVTINAPVVGALGYNVYVGTVNGAATLYYIGRTTGLTFTVQGAASTITTGNTGPYKTTGAVASRAAADTSAYATGYDGILPTVLGPNSGKNNAINALFSTSNPGSEFQTVFGAIYDAVKGDPGDIFLNGSDRKQLSDAIKGGSTANYRLNIESQAGGGITYGSIVTGLQNEVTGSSVNVSVHPWLPQGVAPVISKTLPIPDSQVSNVWENIMVQDYMGIQWPVSQLAYEFSTYFLGTFFCFAPGWNGAVSGITSA